MDGVRHDPVVHDRHRYGHGLTVSVITQVSDLSTFMNVTVDDTRAQQMLNLVEADAGSIVSPLPASAMGVILSAAARAYANPAGVASQSVAGAATAWGGGLYLNKAERRTLRRLAGIGGGAFSINAATGAGKGYRDPLQPLTIDDTEQLMYDYDIPGRPA